MSMQQATFSTSRLSRSLNPFGMSRVLGEADWETAAEERAAADDNFGCTEAAPVMAERDASGYCGTVTQHLNDVTVDGAESSDDSYSPSSFADETRTISVDDSDNTFISGGGGNLAKRRVGDTTAELSFAVNGKRALGGSGFVRVGHYDDIDRKAGECRTDNSASADEAMSSADYGRSGRTLAAAGEGGGGGGGEFQREADPVDVDVDCDDGDDEEAIDMTLASSDSQDQAVSIYMSVCV